MLPRRHRRCLSNASGRALAVLMAVLPLSSPAAGERWWVTSWAAAPSATAEIASPLTVRHIVRLSVGGTALRIRLSNALSANAVTIRAVRVARSAGGPAIVPESDRAVTFGGAPAVTLAPRAVRLSDPVDLRVDDLAKLAVSIALAGGGPVTTHSLGMETAYLADGDVAAEPTFATVRTSRARYVLSGVDVDAPAGTFAVVAVGDSITDGGGTTVDADRRWPDVLAERLAQRERPEKRAVVNAGISGNRVLHDHFGPNLLSRLDADVFSQPHASAVVLLEGINDIGQPGESAPQSDVVSVEQIIAAYREVIARAHAHGLCVFGATLTPFAGIAYPHYYSVEREREREAVNAWIRGGGAFDGVFDFDAALRDPQHPTKLLPLYDSGDHLHPGDAGHAAMAATVDARVLRSGCR